MDHLALDGTALLGGDHVADDVGRVPELFNVLLHGSRHGVRLAVLLSDVAHHGLLLLIITVIAAHDAVNKAGEASASGGTVVAAAGHAGAATVSAADSEAASVQSGKEKSQGDNDGADADERHHVEGLKCN